jgi:hypothetical protein
MNRSAWDVGKPSTTYKIEMYKARPAALLDDTSARHESLALGRRHQLRRSTDPGRSGIY